MNGPVDDVLNRMDTLIAQLRQANAEAQEILREEEAAISHAADETSGLRRKKDYPND